MDKQIRIAVCEDDAADKDRLINIIVNYLNTNGLGAEIDTYSTAEEFFGSDTSVYSLVFLDIYMDELNGMEAAKRLVAQNQSVRIVFCSSSHDFAAESYDVSALHYLIKPVDEEKMRGVLDRFFDGVMKLKSISVRVGRLSETIYLRDIIYAESQNKKTIIHTKHGAIEASMPFSFFCQELKEPDFVKPIRYALAAVSEIIRVPSEKIVLSDKTVLPISRTQRQHIKDVFIEYRWKTGFSEKGGGK